MSLDPQGIPSHDPELDQIRITVGKDRKADHVTVTEGKTADLKHGGEEIADTRQGGEPPRPCLAEEPVACQHGVSGEPCIADEITTGHLLVDVKPGWCLSLESGLAEIAGMVVPERSHPA
jgi:hypothetical protein